jgi:hypothetical protein
MKWKNIALETLKTEFHDKIFRTNDATRVLKTQRRYSKGTVYRVLHDFVKAGSIERLGRGTYRIRMREVAVTDRMVLSDRLIVKLIPGSSEKAKELLRKRGIDFMITGPPLFYRYIHYLPKRLTELIYVVRGAGESTTSALREGGFRALLNPTSSDISLALENFPERDIFVVREFSKLLGNIDGTASLERGLVDLYFETTRRKIPFTEEEVGRVFLKVLRGEPISHSRLLMFANRRGIEEEMKAIIESIEPGASTRFKPKNKHVENLLRVMEEVDLR